MVLIPGVPKTGPRPSVPHPEAVGSQQVASYICFSVTHLVADLEVCVVGRKRPIGTRPCRRRRAGCLSRDPRRRLAHILTVAWATRELRLDEDLARDKILVWAAWRRDGCYGIDADGRKSDSTGLSSRLRSRTNRFLPIIQSHRGRWMLWWALHRRRGLHWLP